MSKYIKALFIIIIPTIAFGNIINIPDDYPTIQEGINASIDGDTVLVDIGTYTENLLISEKDITLASRFIIAGDSALIIHTIIDGDDLASVLSLYYSNGTVVGLTFRHGRAERGGGIYCDNSSPKIIANRFWGNAASASEEAAGGGIYCVNSEPVISNNKIEMNYADGALFPAGGGIYAASSTPMIYNNLIKNNISANGGGIYTQNSNPVLGHNLIIDNDGLFGGGGLYAENSVVEIVNCTFSGNASEWYKGGAIYFDGNYLTISNSILYYNEAAIENPEIHLESGSTDITYTDIDGGWEGIGNLDMHPYFRDIENDFHLMAIECGDSEDSPLIDMGNPDILDLILDCDNGLGTLISDMGAYAGGDSVAVGIDDNYRNILSQINILENYPNPFNARTILSFSIPESQQVQLTIYDMLGRKVSTLVNDFIQAGEHQVTWNANNHASGIYFARISTDIYADSKRLVLVK